MRLRVVALTTFMLLVSAGRLCYGDDSPSNEAHLHEVRAKEFLRVKDYASAIPEFKAAYGSDPLAKYLYNIALASERVGDKNQARSFYKKYIKADPAGKASVHARARIMVLEAEIKKQSVTHHRERANKYRESTLWDAAAVEFRKAYELGNNPSDLFELGETYRSAGEMQKAIAAYKEYLAAAADGSLAATARKRIHTLEESRAAVSTLKADVGAFPNAHASKPRSGRRWLWIAAGVVLVAAGIVADMLPEQNGKLDPIDFLPVGLYGAGSAGLVIGVF